MIPYATVEDLPVRFWRKVDKTGECWEWTGANVRGYGQVSINKKRFYVHRLMLHLVTGFPLESRLVVDHLCKNPPCCNPAHLEAVPSRENTMRGEGPSARNAVKTRCAKGHPYDTENTRVDRRGWRVCRKCHRGES